MKLSTLFVSALVVLSSSFALADFRDHGRGRGDDHGGPVMSRLTKIADSEFGDNYDKDTYDVRGIRGAREVVIKNTSNRTIILTKFSLYLTNGRDLDVFTRDEYSLSPGESLSGGFWGADLDQVTVRGRGVGGMASYVLWAK